MATFVVRIYRAGDKDGCKLTGIAELMDGTGRQRPFADMAELAAILRHHAIRPRKPES